MNSWIDGSLLVRFLRYILNVYGLSSTNKAVKTIKGWCTNSFINKCIVMYLERKPASEYTLTYRFLRVVGRKLDILAGKIHLLFVRYYGSSLISTVFKSFKKESRKSIVKLFLAFSLPLLLGYGLVTTVLGKWSFSEGIKLLVLAVIILVTAFSIDKWKHWLENSALYKLCQFILE